MSTIRFPLGSCTGNPVPIAAASGSSTSVTWRAPAERTASSIARFSTSDASDGTHTRMRGRISLLTPARRSTTSSIRCVVSNSVIVPARSGRTATTLPESPPTASHASSPIATTSPVAAFSATTAGSENTMPSPCR